VDRNALDDILAEGLPPREVPKVLTDDEDGFPELIEWKEDDSDDEDDDVPAPPPRDVRRSTWVTT